MLWASAESKNGRVYYLNKKAEEQSTWVKLGKAFEKETGIPVQIQTGGTDYDATLRSELSKKAAPTMFQADGPSFMSSFKKYAKDLSNSDIYKQLDKNYKNRVLTNDEGKPIAIPYATESYGIIYNKSLLKKYFDASWSTVKSAEDINNFKALKTVADEIQAHKDEIGVKGAFSSAGLDTSSAFRYNFHLPSVPLYYEYADDGVDMTKVPSSVKGTYVKKMKNIFDLYIKDSTVEPSSLSGKTMDDSIAEFATGQAVFFQDGVWAYNQIKGQSVSDNDLGVFPIYIAADEVRHKEHRTEQFRTAHRLREHISDEECGDIDQYGGDDGEGQSEQQRMQEVGILECSDIIFQAYEFGIGDRGEFGEAEIDTHHQRHYEAEGESEACR